MAALRASGARTVLDPGCGGGKLLRELLQDRQFERIVGMDVSVRSPVASSDTQIIGSSGVVRSFRTGRVESASSMDTRFVFCPLDRTTKRSDRRLRWGVSTVAQRVHDYPNLIFAVGTQVVTLRDVVGRNGRTQHPRGFDQVTPTITSASPPRSGSCFRRKARLESNRCCTSIGCC